MGRECTPTVILKLVIAKVYKTALNVFVLTENIFDSSFFFINLNSFFIIALKLRFETFYGNRIKKNVVAAFLIFNFEFFVVYDQFRGSLFLKNVFSEKHRLDTSDSQKFRFFNS
jgi:hypothetical protein